MSLPGWKTPGLVLCAVLALEAFFCTSSEAQNPTGNPPAQPTADSSPQFKVQSNLVVVRVVVRDSNGRPVEGLQKEDLKLFDQGKGGWGFLRFKSQRRGVWAPEAF